MPRPRKPDALSVAERQRRYVRSQDLCTLKLPRRLVQRLDAVARERSLTRGAVIASILDEWDELRSRAAAAEAGVATRALTSSRRMAGVVRQPGGRAIRREEGQRDLFGSSDRQTG